jgi:HlyD family secretion protein
MNWPSRRPSWHRHAAEALASHDLQRQQQLAAQGFVSKHAPKMPPPRCPRAAPAWRNAAAVQVAQLPGRQDERTAQRAAAQAAQEVLQQSQWRTRQKQQSAMQAALVAEVYYRVGEYVQPGSPCCRCYRLPISRRASSCPSEDVFCAPVRLSRFPATAAARFIPAQISRIATQPEFTPPVIYSNGQRSKLVFMVEARPQLKDATRLKPGQPLDVRLAATASVQGS